MLSPEISSPRVRTSATYYRTQSGYSPRRGLLYKLAIQIGSNSSGASVFGQYHRRIRTTPLQLHAYFLRKPTHACAPHNLFLPQNCRMCGSHYDLNRRINKLPLYGSRFESMLSQRRFPVSGSRAPAMFLGKLSPALIAGQGTSVHRRFPDRPRWRNLCRFIEILSDALKGGNAEGPSNFATPGNSTSGSAAWL